MRRNLVALALSLCLLPSAGCKKSKPKPADVKDVVEVIVDEKGFHPSIIPARRGRPITLVFTRKTDKTCATEVLISDERIRRDLPLDTSVPITFIPSKSGDETFACAMNMVKGTIQVLP